MEAVLQAANTLREYTSRRQPCTSIRDVSCGFLTEVVNGMFGTAFGRSRGQQPVADDNVDACAAAIDYIARNVLHLQLNHISADAILVGDRRAAANFLEVLLELQRQRTVTAHNDSLSANQPDTSHTHHNHSSDDVHQDAIAGLSRVVREEVAAVEQAERQVDELRPPLQSARQRQSSPRSLRAGKGPLGLADESQDGQWLPLRRELDAWLDAQAAPAPMRDVREIVAPGPRREAAIKAVWDAERRQRQLDRQRLAEVVNSSSAHLDQPQAATAAMGAGHASNAEEPALADIFPNLSLSPHSQRKLWQREYKRMEARVRNVLQKRPVHREEKELQRLEQEHDRRMSAMRKSIAHEQRLKELREQRAQELAVQGMERDRRQDRVQMRQTYEEFHRLQQARGEQRKLREEKILQRYFEDELANHRERLRTMEKYAREAEHNRETERETQLAGLQQYYKDQLAIMEEMLQERMKTAKTESKELEDVRRKAKQRLKQKMKEEIRTMLDDLFQEETAEHFRRLDAGQTGASAR